MNAALEIHNWHGAGYCPLVFSDDWQLALLNWEPSFSLENLGEIERHVASEEVFVLVHGRALLFVFDAAGQLASSDMQPGVVHNVLRGSWHNLLATPDASWVIVEKRDTHLHDTHLRQMVTEERQALLERLPSWASLTVSGSQRASRGAACC